MQRNDVYNITMCYKILNLNCSGKVFFGPIPFLNEMLELKNNGVQVVWNLLDSMSNVEEEKKVFTEVFHSPIEDYSIPDNDSNFLQSLENICNKLQDGKNVLVHCFGGSGRTGMALASILMKINHLSAKEALELTEKACQGPELEIQKDFVKSLKINKK